MSAYLHYVRTIIVGNCLKVKLNVKKIQSCSVSHAQSQLRRSCANANVADSRPERVFFILEHSSSADVREAFASARPD